MAHKLTRHLLLHKPISATQIGFPAYFSTQFLGDNPVLKTCNNDKRLSEIQLEHEKEDEFVVVVVKAVHECRH
ncbi:hypothetical protein Tco_0362810 [Tanacetum coccineum]